MFHVFTLYLALLGALPATAGKPGIFSESQSLGKARNPSKSQSPGENSEFFYTSLHIFRIFLYIPKYSFIFSTYFFISFTYFHTFLHILHIFPNKGRIMENLLNFSSFQFLGWGGGVVGRNLHFKGWGRNNGTFPKHDVIRG